MKRLLLLQNKGFHRYDKVFLEVLNDSFQFIAIAMKGAQDNEFVLVINVVKIFFVFFIYIHKSYIIELANKVIVHFGVFIPDFTNFQLEVRDFSFEI